MGGKVEMLSVQLNELYKNFQNLLKKTLYQSYLPTPSLRQDMTQGQFLSGV